MNRPQLRAALILQVRSGQLTAQQAARQLGISRQRYYHWEKRALKALLSSLQDRPTGRPSNKPDPHTQKLLQRIQQLEQQVQTLQLKDQLHQRLKDLRNQADRKKNSR